MFCVGVWLAWGGSAWLIVTSPVIDATVSNLLITIYRTGNEINEGWSLTFARHRASFPYVDIFDSCGGQVHSLHHVPVQAALEICMQDGLLHHKHI